MPYYHFTSVTQPKTSTSHQMTSPFRKVKRTKSSMFTAFIRFFSKIYILPLRFNQDQSKVEFSIFHYKTFISFFLNSLPSMFSFILWSVQDGFYPQYMDASLTVYTEFDFFFVVLFFYENIAPIAFSFIIISSQVWAATPELSLDIGISFSQSRRSLICSLVISFLGLFCVIFGSYLSLAPKFPDNSTLQNISNLIFAFIIPWIWSSFITFLSFAMLLAIIQKMTEKVENVPSFDVESWAFDTIELFNKLQRALNFPCLFIITGR